MAIGSDDVLLETPPRTGRLRPRIFVWAALIALAVVLIGFARTYYLRGFFTGAKELSSLMHLHGIVMTLWFATLVLQVTLVARGNIALHRKVGNYGMALAVVVLVVGTATAITAARNGVSPGPPPLVFLAIPMADMVVFGTLVALAFAYRRRGDYHKRFMIAASLGILTAAIARIPYLPGGVLGFFGITDLILLGVIAADTIPNRRLHPAFAIGFAIVFLSQIGRLLVARSPQWLEFARWITG